MKSNNSVASRARRKKVLKQAKGMQQNRRRSYRAAKQAVTRSLEYSYRDRRNRKRNMRQLWIQRLNAALKAHGVRYSQFQNDLKKKNISLNRKTLSQIAATNNTAFASIVKAVQEQG
jgi:large subunit ribosomal protein L20